MAFGILEPKLTHGLYVPGTALLEDVAEAPHAERLKHAETGDGKILLVPQPSNDPNDPLNWPLWQRDFIFVLLCYCTILCAGVLGPLISPAAADLVMQFDISFTQVSLLTGYQLCAVGAFGIFMSTLARLYGKRPVFVLSMALALAGSLWCSFASSYSSIVGARVLQGVGISVWESIMYSVTGDLYFVHQRGARMAFFGVCASGWGNLGTLIAGVIAEDKNWRWAFYILNIFLGIGAIGILLLGWEITYNRDETTYQTETLATMNTNEYKAEHGLQEQEVTSHQGSTLVRKPYVRRLAVFSGRYTDDPFIRLLIRPFTICTNPAVLWSVMTLSFATCWNVVISFVLSQVFSAPPFLLNTAQVGYIYAGPVIGAVLGAMVCGLLSDRVAEYCARRNNGIYEPEFRLFLVVGMAVFMTLAFFLFGNLIEAGKPPVVAAVNWAIAIVGFQFCSTAMGTYMVDGYNAISIEIFIIGMIVKNFLLFGFTFFINDWIANWGPAKMFDCIAGVQLGICALTIPMYIYGKRCRNVFRYHSAVQHVEPATPAEVSETTA